MRGTMTGRGFRSWIYGNRRSIRAGRRNGQGKRIKDPAKKEIRQPLQGQGVRAAWICNYIRSPTSGFT